MNNKKIFYGWYAVIGAFFAAGAAAGTSITSFGTLAVPVTSALNITVTSYMFSMTILLVASMLLAPITGRLIQSKGLRFTTVLGGVLMTVGHVFLGFANNIPLLYAGHVIVGISSGIAGPVIATSTAARWFNKKRGLATGIITAGNGLFGMVLAPILAKICLNFSYNYAYFFLGLVDLVCIAIIGGVLIRNSPEEMGLHPDGTDQAEEVNAIESEGFTFNQAIKTSAFWIIGVGFAFLSMAQFGQSQTHNAAIQSMGFDPMVAAKVVSIVGIASAIIKLVYGYLLDRISFKIVTAMGVVSSIIASIMLYSFNPNTNIMTLYIYAAIFACGYGMWLPICSKHITLSFGAKYYPVIFSIVFMFKNFGDMFASMIPSGFYDATGSYAPGYLVFTGVLIVCGLALLTYKRPKITKE